jgi:hypothetical protein
LFAPNLAPWRRASRHPIVHNHASSASANFTVFGQAQASIACVELERLTLITDDIPSNESALGEFIKFYLTTGCMAEQASKVIFPIAITKNPTMMKSDPLSESAMPGSEMHA